METRGSNPTVNLYGWYAGVGGNCVEQVWPITARRRSVLRFVGVAW
jgi:hypothetical protein